MALGDRGRAGTGRWIAQSLAAAGAKVACIDVNVETLADTVAAIRGAAARPNRSPAT